MHLPDEGNSVADFLRVPEGSSERGPDPKDFLRDVVDDGVAPSLELIRCSTGSVNVASWGDVNGWSACVPVAPVTNEAGGDEV